MMFARSCRGMMAAAVLVLAQTVSFSAQAALSPETVDGAKTVDVVEAKALFEKGVKFLDVRSFVAFDAGRVPGAIHIELKKHFNEMSLNAAISPQEPFVVYCNGPSCLRAGKAASKAVKWGYDKVYYFRDGIPAWEKASFPFE